MTFIDNLVGTAPNGLDANIGWSGGGIGGISGTIGVGGGSISIGGGGAGGGGSARDIAVATVNAYEVRLRSNFEDYRAGRKSANDAAGYFDTQWNQMVASLMTLGSEGTRAISDRQQGGKFDWFSAYRPAGAQPPNYVPPTGGGSGVGGSITIGNGGGGAYVPPVVYPASGSNTWLLLGAMAVIAWFLLKR